MGSVTWVDIGRIILRVRDLETSVEFWASNVGLDLAFRSEGFAFFDGGGTQLVLNEVAFDLEDTSLTEVVFEVDDILATHAALAARGVPFEVEPRMVTSDANRELWASHFRDPDGHLASVTGWVDRS